MGRLFYLVFVVVGLAAAVLNRRAAARAHENSARIFHRPLRPGSAESRFMTVFSRTLAVVVGLTMAVLGVLGATGVIWQNEHW
jgi:hypothetical protein